MNGRGFTPHSAFRTPRWKVFPFERDKPNRHGVEETAFVKAVRDPGHRVHIGGELDALEQDGSVRCDRSDLCHQCLAQGEDDVPILVGILEYRIAPIILQSPAGGGDDLVVAIEGFVAGDEVENRHVRAWSVGAWSVDSDGDDGAEARAAVGEGDETIVEDFFKMCVHGLGWVIRWRRG